MSENNPDHPLRVEIEHEQLVIRIGIGMLAFAFENLDESRPFDGELNDFYHKYRVNNPLEFAKDVRCAMLDEAENGATPLSDFLDKMCNAAVDDGSIAVNEMKPGEYKCQD